MKIAPGRRFILRMPPSVPWSLVISSVSLAASFLVIRSKSPVCWRASSCSSRPIRFLIVTKLVSMPPSQRLLTYGWPARVASWATGSWACFFVPTKRTWSPRATVSRTNSRATSRRLDGLGEVDDVDPVALREDERASSWDSSGGSGGRSGLRPRAAAASKRTARWATSCRFVPPRTSSPGTGRPLRPLPAPSRSERSACVLRAVVARAV